MSEAVDPPLGTTSPSPDTTSFPPDTTSPSSDTTALLRATRKAMPLEDLPSLDPTSTGTLAAVTATNRASDLSAHDAAAVAALDAADGAATSTPSSGRPTPEQQQSQQPQQQQQQQQQPQQQSQEEPHQESGQESQGEESWVWRKVLYLRQPFEDTHTDPNTFLADMRTNAGVVKPRYWSLVRDSSVLTLQLFLVSALVIVYLLLDSHRLSARSLFLLDSLSLAAGVLLSSLASLHLQRQKRLQQLLKAGEEAQLMQVRQVQQQQHKKQQGHQPQQQHQQPQPPPPPSLPPSTLVDLLSASRFPRLIVDCAIFVFGLYLLSPILHTLTQSISSDTVASCTTLLFLLHLFFHDYNYSTAATLSFSGNLSLMSAIYASVLLASRLSTTAQVYSFMWLALSVFSLLPSLLHHWRRANPQTHRVLVWGMKAVSLAILMAWSKAIALVVVVAAAAVTYVFPLLFVYMHKEKQFIKGPWDEAQPGTSTA